MSQPRWIYFFGDGGSEGDPARKEVLGGKGASLAGMSRAGLPVPPGFTISVECCRHYHANGHKWPAGLEEQLKQYISRLEEVTGRPFGQGPRPLLVSVRSGAAVSMPGMMDTLLNCGLHPALADDLADKDRFWLTYRQFVQQFAQTVADVKLDGQHTSAPGQAVASGQSAGAKADRELAEAVRKLYESKTGRPFPATPWQTLVECVNAVFESWNSDRAVVYRKSQDVRGVDGTAVNVQAMFPSEVSGIAFTANPADPLARDIVIESSYGLGEAIVSGGVSPDLFIVDRDSMAIKDRTLGHKVHAVAALDGPAAARALDPKAFSLSDDQVLQVARLALKVEKHYGFPVDIEWAFAGGQFALLQSRPVRGLEVALDIEVGRQEEIARLKSLAAGKRKVWVTHNLGETLPNPTPLTWDIIRHFMSGRGGFGLMYRHIGYHPSASIDKDGILELICGQIYADPDRAAELFASHLPKVYDLDAVAEDPGLLETAPNKFDPKRADAMFLLRLPKMIAGIIRTSRRTRRARRGALERFDSEVLPPYLAYVERKRAQDLTRLSTREVIDELHARNKRVMDEFGAESLKPGFFGGVARGELEGILTRLMGAHAARDLVATLTSGLDGDSTIEQNAMLFRVARGQADMGEFLRRYGHRTVGEMELSIPRWHEDHSYLDGMLAAHRRPAARSPEELHAANVERRLAAQRELPGVLAKWGGSCQQEEVMAVLAEAQKLLPHREVAKHYLMMGYDLLRRAIMELSRRWDLGRDIFFLKLEELGRFEKERVELSKLIASRKVRWQSAQRLLPADVIDSDNLDNLGFPDEVESAHQLDALPLAPGMAEGEVRIVHSPDQATDLPDDCILVCPSTDPGWTALFVSIRGLVVERGGVLSHGAITARDFGIPAVACHQATRRLASARRIRVDGGAGQVTVLNGECLTH
ncbi:MAG: PEP/pyruvate-binding domain-containing protein [Phycisphaerae bacterium]